MRSLFFKSNIFIFFLLWASNSALAGPSLSRILGLDQSISAAGNELRASIVASENALLRIGSEYNQDVEERLNQVDEIVSSALDKIDALRQQGKVDGVNLLNSANTILSQAIMDAKELEDKIRQDLYELIYESECAVARTIQEVIPETLGGIGSLIVANEITLTLPPIYEGEKNRFCLSDCRIERTFKIRRPYSITYREVRDYLLSRLDQMPDHGPIETLISTYEFLSAFARRAACFVPGSGQRYIAQHIKYRAAVERWTSILGPGVGMDP